jgi:hypothetical protein
VAGASPRVNTALAAVMMQLAAHGEDLAGMPAEPTKGTDPNRLYYMTRGVRDATSGYHLRLFQKRAIWGCTGRGYAVFRGGVMLDTAIADLRVEVVEVEAAEQRHVDGGALTRS